MRVLVFHGYLLRGTGSNVYTANLTRALSRLGHDVELLCQDRRAGELDLVDAVGDARDRGFEVTEAGGASEGEPARGRVTAYVPDIGGLLPVYVADAYEGIEARTFAEISDAELERYLERNVAAVRAVAAAGPPLGAAIANHLVMGPVILARAAQATRADAAPALPSFAAKVHGSALEYTVAPEPERFKPYAAEGIAAARGVMVGSRHTAERLWAVLDEPDLEAKTRLGPPGVDIERFAPAPPDAARERVRELAATIARRAQATADARPAGGAGAQPSEGSFSRDDRAAADALAHFADAPGPRVAFVGKLIVSKGVDLLLAAWPLVVVRHPGARLLVAGFGAYREGLERLKAALDQGDLEAAARLAATGREPEGGPADPPLHMLDAFLRATPAGYAEAARAAAGSVALSGRLDHDEVAEVLPAADAMVVPSTFPEAFGMVAAEAAACGLLPVVADHSGLAEVAAGLTGAAGETAADLLTFPLGAGAVEAIAARVNRWLDLDPADRRDTGALLATAVAERWSWEAVARGALAASAGRLRELPPVPPSGARQR